MHQIVKLDAVVQGLHVTRQKKNKQQNNQQRESELSEQARKGNVTRTTLSKAGCRDAASGLQTQAYWAGPAPLKSTGPNFMLFMTNADVEKKARARQGQLGSIVHENEPGTAGIMEGFRKDFRRYNTAYVRGARPARSTNKIWSERSGPGRFDVDVIQNYPEPWGRLSISQKKGRLRTPTCRRETPGLQGGPS